MACTNDKGLKKVHCASGTRTVGISWEESCKRLDGQFNYLNEICFEIELP